ncbi:MAG: hypothetical protein L0Y71_04055 [Gemmataceae bacterium]|nr:hypothetical protein [Gemmataceae bacterium]
MNELRDASSDVVYRPLSAMAVIGFGMSCLFGGVVALSTLMAIAQGAAFFFSNWILLLALVGFLVSWWGLNDVRNSEGTKAGQKLATLGMWISLVSGCGYFAYSYFTGLALSQQAFAFLLQADDESSGFVPRVQKGAAHPVELRRAFLLTLPAPDRAGLRAEDENQIKQSQDRPRPDGSPGPFSLFRSHHLIQNLMHGGGNTTIEPLGVKRWTYEKRSYYVSCLLRMATPEATADVLISVRSSEGESAGEKRQWFVDLTNIGYTSLEFTPLGKGIKVLREHANMHMQQLDALLKKGGKLGDFDRIDATDWKALGPTQEQEYKSRLAAIVDGRAANANNWHFTFSREFTNAPWEQDAEGRVTLTMPLSVMLLNERQVVVSSVECLLTLRSKTAVNPEQVGATDAPLLPQWDAVGFKLVRVQHKRTN